MATDAEVNEGFREHYLRSLKERLLEKLEEGTLESYVDGDTIDGGMLTGCDEDGLSFCQTNYSWRGVDVIAILRDAGADVYEGIDFPAIVAEIRAAA